ncbi:MAG: hypothetical protein ACTTGZ_04465 [Treponema sp.]
MNCRRAYHDKGATVFCKPAIRSNCCISSTFRFYPAQDIFSVVRFVYIFQRINRSFLLLLDFAADAYRETYAKVCKEDLAKEGKKNVG